MDTKTVGVKLFFDVPEWVLYIAQDRDGDWFGWEMKPTMAGDRWINGGDCHHIVSDPHGNDDWKITLQKV